MCHRLVQSNAVLTALVLSLFTFNSVVSAQTGFGPSGANGASSAPFVEPPLAGPTNSPLDATPKKQVVADVQVQGASFVPADEYLRRLKTRVNRQYDPDDVQADVEELHRLKIVQNVRSFIKSTPAGVVVTFKIYERAFITKVEYVGNRAFPDRRLEKLTGISKGKPLDIVAVKMAKRQLEDFYQTKGFARTQVEILAGDQRDDREVIFLIHEDEKRIVRSVRFEGNTIDSDGRLKTYIKSKPPIAGVYGGIYQKVEVEQDVQRLTAYYRSLGFFYAKVDREIQFDKTGTKVDLRFIISEGPRYRIQSVAFSGNEKYGPDHLKTLVRSEANQYYDSRRLQSDLSKLRDLYGSDGHIAVDVQAEPRLFEEPGKLDLVFNIKEGPQYRVGDIKVHIDGDYGITRQTVILDRLGLHRGDVVDVRKIRSAERRLSASQLFTGARNDGPPPRIVVNPRDGSTQLASGKRSGFRGQSPDQSKVKLMDLDIFMSRSGRNK